MNLLLRLGAGAGDRGRQQVYKPLSFLQISLQKGNQNTGKAKIYNRHQVGDLTEENESKYHLSSSLTHITSLLSPLLLSSSYNLLYDKNNLYDKKVWDEEKKGFNI